MRLMQAWQVAPLSGPMALLAKSLVGWMFILSLLWLGMAIYAPFLTVGTLYFPHRRHYAPFSLAIWLVAWLSWPLSHQLKPLRTAGLVRLTRQARPLIAAIENYRKVKGRYPATLQALTPRFIASIPHTSAAAYPDFKYQTASADTLFKSYEIRVNTPSGGINFDVFVFWPEGGYPPQMYGGHIEPINGWAYVHE